MPPIARVRLTPKPATALFALGIIGYLGENLSPYFTTAIQSGLKVDTVTASSVTTALFIATAIAGILAAPVAAGLRRRALARIGLAASATGFAAAALVETLPLMFAAAVLAGLGAGMIVATSGATMAAFLNPDRVAGIAGLINGAMTAAVLAIVPLFGLLPLNVFLPLASLCLVTLLITGWIPQATVPVEALPMDVSTLSATIEGDRVSEKTPRSVLLAGISLLVIFPIWGLAETSVWGMASVMAADHVGMSEDESGLIFSIGEVAALIGAGILAVVGRRLGRALPLAILMILNAALKVVLGVLVDPTVWSIGFILWDFVSVVAFLYLLATAAGLDVTGRWSAPMSAVYMIGTAFSPIVGALLIESIGVEGFTWVVASLGLLVAVPVAWIARVSSRRERQQEAEAATALTTIDETAAHDV